MRKANQHIGSRGAVLLVSAHLLLIGIAVALLVAGMVRTSPAEVLAGLGLILVAAVRFAMGRDRRITQVRERHDDVERLKDMAAASSDWLWEMGPDLRFTYFSERVTGFELTRATDLIGKTRFEVAETELDPDAWARHADDLQKRLPFRDFMFRQRAPDGQLRWRKISGKPFFAADGRFLGYRGSGTDVTAQKEAELALAAVQEERAQIHEKFRSLVSHIPGAVYRCLPDGLWTPIFLSENMEKVSGYPASDFVGNSVRTLGSIMHPDDMESGDRVVHEALANRMPFTVEFRIIHRDGSIRWLSERGQAVYDNDGRPLYIDGVTFDITHLKTTQTALAKALEELTDSQTKFRSMVANLPGTVYRCAVAPGWPAVFISDMIEQLTGYPASDFVGPGARSLSSHVHSADLDPTNRIIWQAIEKRQPYSIEYRMIHRDGSTRWIQENGQPVFDEAGLPRFIDGVTLDVTERKSVETALASALGELRENEAKFRSLVTNIRGAASRCLLDAEWTQLFISDAIHEISGYPASDFIGNQVRSFASITHPDDRTAARGLVTAAVAANKPFDLQYRLMHRDGSIRWVHEKGQVVFDGGGQPLYVDSVIVDITSQKAAQAEVVAAKEEAIRANRAKSDFLAAMSHELRTPLNAIIGFSEILTGQHFGPLGSARYVEYARDINKSGEHLLELINDILDLSKAEAGKMDLHDQPIEIAEVIDECLAMIGDRARQARIAVVAEIPAPLPRVLADRLKLKQALLNLLSNSIKFTPEGGCIALTAALDSEALRVAVRDTGVGMAPDDIPTALAPFGQINVALSRRHAGTGLGLPLTKRLVELHGARLHLESQIGIGTTVTIEFPPDRLLASLDQSGTDLAAAAR